MNTDTVTCEVTDAFPDMMPGTYVYAKCTDPAIELVWGGASQGHPDFWLMLLCAKHKAEAADDVLGTEPVTPHYVQGYHQGATEATVFPLTERQMVCLVHEDDLADDVQPRTPLTGEWADEAVDWSDEAVEQYQGGFARGWQRTLEFRAGEWYESDEGHG